MLWNRPEVIGSVVRSYSDVGYFFSADLWAALATSIMYPSKLPQFKFIINVWDGNGSGLFVRDFGLKAIRGIINVFCVVRARSHHCVDMDDETLNFLMILMCSLWHAIDKIKIKTEENNLNDISMIAIPLLLFTFIKRAAHSSQLSENQQTISNCT